ncbi:MAG: helix-turn-helix transcriptional regulator [Pseudomonadota bacterium]
MREARERRGLTQQQLAELAGTSQPQIDRLETGKRRLTIDWVVRLAPFLGVTPIDLSQIELLEGAAPLVVDTAPRRAARDGAAPAPARSPRAANSPSRSRSARRRAAARAKRCSCRTGRSAILAGPTACAACARPTRST